MFLQLEAAAPNVLAEAKAGSEHVGAGPAVGLRPAMSGPIREETSNQVTRPVGTRDQYYLDSSGPSMDRSLVLCSTRSSMPRSWDIRKHCTSR